MLLGLISFLNDVASEMIAPLMPIFLVSVLGGSPAIVGLMDGLADAASSLLKLVAGRRSDRTGRRKPFMILGYAIPSATRPLYALVGAPWHAVGLRVLDRVGKGLRTAPRDALLAAAVPAEHHARGFAFHRAMDHAGAFAGAGIAWALLMTADPDLRAIFAWSAVPALAATALTLGVRERRVAPVVATFPPVDPNLRPLLVAIGLAGLGLAGDAFLVLRAAEVGVPLAAVPPLWMGLHAVKVVASLGSGRVADRLGRRGTLVAGWIARAGLYLAFAAVADPIPVAALFVAFGVHAGLTEGAERALVAQVGGTGTHFGWYHLVSGAVALPAGLVFGGIWTVWGAPVAFAVAAVVTLAGVGRLVGMSWRDAP